MFSAKNITQSEPYLVVAIDSVREYSRDTTIHGGKYTSGEFV